MVVIEGTANWHINFDGQVNKQNTGYYMKEEDIINVPVAQKFSSN